MKVNEVIEKLDEILKDNGEVYYKASLDTSEDLDIWNAVVAYYSRSEDFYTEIFSSPEGDPENVTLKVEAIAW